MAKKSRVENDVLLRFGLEAMSRGGKPLRELPSKGRSMLYKLANGETVRLRTCNDHLLIVVAKTPDLDADLNIEGTDWLLIVMPEIERTPGKMIAYFVPTSEAVHEARRTHEEWLKSKPKTKGDNTTWNLWFRSNGREKANNYADKWAKYRLPHFVSEALQPDNSGNIRAEVEAARKRIAAAADVPIEAVKIVINFEG